MSQTNSYYSSQQRQQHLEDSFSSSILPSLTRSIASILLTQIIEEKSNKVDYSSELCIFSEEKYILEDPNSIDSELMHYLRRMPTLESVSSFIQALYDCGSISPQCMIICLIYIHRLQSFCGQYLTNSNWRPIVLTALLIAQKIWGPNYLSSDQFAYIYPFFRAEELDEMEQKFLEVINLEVKVTSAIYSKYYIEIRGIHNELWGEFPLRLNTQEMLQLEGRSQYLEVVEKQKSQSLASKRDEASFVLTQCQFLATDNSCENLLQQERYSYLHQNKY